MCFAALEVYDDTCDFVALAANVCTVINVLFFDRFFLGVTVVYVSIYDFGEIRF